MKEPAKEAPEYALIYIIHGDSDYLYHQNGKAYKADDEALKQAFDVALNAKNGEVFIFHQKPERKAFLLFPKKDRTFYHYRNGDLVTMEKYSPEDENLNKEFRLINQNYDTSVTKASLFYFGHEIPNSGTVRYHKSLSGTNFNIDNFSKHLSELPYSLELIALSTCNNGTPEVAQELSGKAEVLLASPQNLHLSYLSTNKILMKEEYPEISSLKLANSIAKDSFEQLTSFVETEVALSVYDLKIVADYVPELASISSEHNESLINSSYGKDNLDCQDIEEFLPLLKTNGVRAYYNSSMFGKRAQKNQHSGWGCKP